MVPNGHLNMIITFQTSNEKSHTQLQSFSDPFTGQNHNLITKTIFNGPDLPRMYHRYSVKRKIRLTLMVKTTLELR